MASAADEAGRTRPPGRARRTARPRTRRTRAGASRRPSPDTRSSAVAVARPNRMRPCASDPPGRRHHFSPCRRAPRTGWLSRPSTARERTSDEAARSVADDRTRRRIRRRSGVGACRHDVPPDGARSSGADAPAGAASAAAEPHRAKAQRSCRYLRRHLPRGRRVPRRCRYSEVPGSRRAQRRARPPAIGGAGDQYLPFDNGRRVEVSQGNNENFSHHFITTQFGWDFALPVGTTVRAALAGEVIVAAGGCAVYGSRYSGCGGGWGNTVVVREGGGSCARYAHLASIGPNIHNGRAVGRYEVIGALGSSGSSDGPHLHCQRENCASRASLPSAFVDAGVPRRRDVVVSRNAPEPAPPPPPLQGSSPPLQGSTPPLQGSTPPVQGGTPPSGGGTPPPPPQPAPPPPPPVPTVHLSKGALSAGPGGMHVLGLRMDGRLLQQLLEPAATRSRVAPATETKAGSTRTTARGAQAARPSATTDSPAVRRGSPSTAELQPGRVVTHALCTTQLAAARTIE